MEIREQAAAEVQGSLVAFEASLQETFARYGELTTALARAPGKAEVSLTYGHSVMERLAPIGPLLVNVRSATLDGHRGLEAISRKLQIAMSPPPDKEDPRRVVTPTGLAPADEVIPFPSRVAS